MPKPNIRHILIALAILGSVGTVTLALITSGKTASWQISLPFLQLPNSLKPTPTPARQFPNVLFPQAPDPSGRNIYYTPSTLGRNIRYSGTGIQALPSGTRFKNEKGKTVFSASASSTITNYIVGSFDYWDEIPGTKDRYLILKNLPRAKDGQTETLPKIRIGPEVNFGAEDLNSVIPKTINPGQGAATYSMGPIADFSSEDLARLIQPGDTLSLTIKPDLQKQQDMLDQNGFRVAYRLFIRRFDPQKLLPEELGREINFQ